MRPSSTGTQVLLVLACLVVVISGLKAASAIVVPLLMAVFLAIIATPPMQWLQRRGLPVWAALALILMMLVGAIIVIGSLIGASIDQLSAALPRYEAQLRALIDDAARWATTLGLALPPGGMVDMINPGAAARFFGRLISGFGSLLANSLLIIFTVLFLLVEAAAIPAKLRAILPDADKSLDNLSEFLASVKSYLVIKAAMSFVTGLTVTVWLLILGVDFAVLWGGIAFFMNFVPYLGSIIAAVPAVILSLLDAGPMTALLVASGYVAVNLVVGNWLEPRFMGRGLGLSTLVVFISLVFWGWIFGPVGMFLSTPLTMLVKIALESDPRSRWLAVLLSAQAPADTPDPS
ncbi:MAG TPA: hypothetical protein DF863_05455 [Gammaproteobacteria bacterium]|nr:hypothetical protein [Acidiferrobacteraceae bacterium]HCV20893.1 hypothetical protein [Gammaproteobacteria bacterium]HCY12306.1 hypothetical protein [Gammaproteobacteria bacterium]